MKKKSKALDLELTSSSILIETGGKKMKKLLIIYYSWSNGNTERIAKMLQSETDSDIIKIDKGDNNITFTSLYHESKESSDSLS